MAVFVLGAGATRGSSFVKESKHCCLPPLDADFFTQLQLIQNDKHKVRVGKVIKSAVDLYGTNFQISLEQMYTTIEHAIQMIDVTQVEKKFTAERLKGMRRDLEQSIAAVLEDSLTESSDGGRSTHKSSSCDHHDRLVESVLRKNDAIISFNYDCVIDSSLKRKGGGKWSPRYGYGFKLGSHGKLLTGDDHWRPHELHEPQETVKLYKLHGSLHFQFTPKQGAKETIQVTLKQRPYNFQRDQMRFNIIPPAWNKVYGEQPFRTLWKGASDELAKTFDLVFIGYSMPPTDLHATSLFRTSVSKKLKSLVVVNPDKGARQRIRSTFEAQLTNTTKVLSFESWQSFLACNRAVWDNT